MTRQRILFAALLTVSAPAFAQDGAPATPPTASANARSVESLALDISAPDDATVELATDELKRRGKVASPAVAAAIRSAPAAAKLRLVKLLRVLGEAASAGPALAAVYKDSTASLELRGEAALALGDLQVASAIPDLIEGLADNMFKISETARIALVRMGADAVAPVVAALRKELGARDGRDGVLFRGILILGDLGGDKARDLLIEVLKIQKGPKAVGLRHHAALALGLMQDKRAIGPLVDAYESERDLSVASVIVRSLEWLTDEHTVPPQPYRWRAWWKSNEKRFVLDPAQSQREEDILLPKNGIPKGAPLEGPTRKTPEAPK